MPSSKKTLTWEKNERSKTANCHWRDRLSFISTDSQSEFSRHENRVLGSGLGDFYLSDVEENLRGWWLSRVFRLRGVQIFGLQVEISEKLKSHSRQVLPKRWIVERTFAWLNHSRRLSKDYELTVASAETLIKISHIHNLLKHLWTHVLRILTNSSWQLTTKREA